MNDLLAPQFRHELATWLRANRRRLSLALFDTSTSQHVFCSRSAQFKMSDGTATEFLFAPVEAE